MLSISSLTVYPQAGAPAPYYNGFNFSQSGMALKNALASKITASHTKILTYQQAENALKIVDLDPENTTNTNVLLIYGFSSDICPTSSATDKDHRRRNKESDGGGASCEWNREHTYAKSLGTPDLGESGPGADAHHLRAADVQRNGDRGSEKFAAGSGDSHDVNSSTWYPGDEWKGDVARMMMYMYLRYGSRCLPKNVGVGVTVATDTNMIDLFLQWNAEDPVSQYEDNRNTYLGNASNQYGQGNRNPFIDNPYLATMIWGGPIAENRWPSLAVSDLTALNKVIVFPNPANENTINIYSETSIDRLQLVNINGQVIRDIQNPLFLDKVFTLQALPSGFYFIRLTSENRTATQKVLVN
jgi:endonuclease I